MRPFHKAAFFTIAVVVFYAAAVHPLEIGKGDILVFKETVEGDAVYLLHRDEQYRADELFYYVGDYEPLYDMDHSRNRIYLGTQYSRNVYYVDLNAPPYSIKIVNFFPDDTHFVCAARDGYRVILYKLIGDDIYAEENPVYPRPRKAWGEKPAMLFNYDMASGELSRLTYFYTQWAAWVSPDSRYLAYHRFAPWSESYEGAPHAWREGQFVLCKTDGTKKFDLSGYFKSHKPKLRWVLADPRAEAFVLQPIKIPGYDAAYLVYLVPPAWAASESFTDIFEYYTATIRVKDETLDCLIEKKNLYVPEGFKSYGLNPYYSDDEEIYFTAYDDAGVRWLFLHNFSTGESKKIPGTDGLFHFIVY